MSRPRRYGFTVDVGDVLTYLFVSFAIMFLVGHVLVSIGNGWLP